VPCETWHHDTAVIIFKLKIMKSFITKSFEDLEFYPSPLGGKRATMTFKDGSEIVVYKDVPNFFCDEHRYEMLSSRLRNAAEGRYVTEVQISKHILFIEQNPIKKWPTSH